MRILGLVLVVLGVLGLAYGGITYTRRREAINLGPISATVKERERVPISPLLSGVVLAAGVGLLVASRRRRG